MCAFKTGTLARLSAKIAALVCGAHGAGTPDKKGNDCWCISLLSLAVDAIGRFAEAIGVAFQIQDDILNLVGEKFGDLKGVGEDIHEGKRTLMVLHALEHAQAADVMCYVFEFAFDFCFSFTTKGQTIERDSQFAPE
jgi:geranylgeranyl pyrophosphate synthase